MKTRHRLQGLGLAGLAFALVSVTGCQTWVAGMTLPSPHYLQHPPQYFAPSPAFPLSRELATMEAQEGAPAAAGAALLPAPAPIAPPPGAGAVPLPPPAPAQPPPPNPQP